MKRFLLIATLVLWSSLTLANNRGEALYGAWPAPFAPEGFIAIMGDAGKALFNDMKDAKQVPAAADLENRKPEDIGLNDCETRYSEHISCKKVPRFTQGGTALERDSAGKVLYHFQCFIKLTNVNTGELKSNTK